MGTQRIVSVVIGTRNRPDTLAAALASIRALEGPDLTFEILVGDNGTTPETRGVVEAAGGRYFTTDVYGCPAARNLALAHVTGEFVAFLDDDDLWLQGHIRPHIAFLDSHPDFAAVFGQIISTDPDLTPQGPAWPEVAPSDPDMFRHMLGGYFPQVGATLVRASVAQRTGLMDESLIGDSDWDWQLRIARDHKIGFLTVPCVLFRQRPKGSFDKLQVMRTKYTRKIFFRHALPNRRRWPSLRALAQSYFGAVGIYFAYFCEAVEVRAARGDRWGSIAALWAAFLTVPTWTVSNLVRKSSLQDAFFHLFHLG